MTSRWKTIDIASRPIARSTLLAIRPLSRNLEITLFFALTIPHFFYPIFFVPPRATRSAHLIFSLHHFSKFLSLRFQIASHQCTAKKSRANSVFRTSGTPFLLFYFLRTTKGHAFRSFYFLISLFFEKLFSSIWNFFRKIFNDFCLFISLFSHGQHFLANEPHRDACVKLPKHPHIVHCLFDAYSPGQFIKIEYPDAAKGLRSTHYPAKMTRITRFFYIHLHRIIVSIDCRSIGHTFSGQNTEIFSILTSPQLQISKFFSSQIDDFFKKTFQFSMPFHLLW